MSVSLSLDGPSVGQVQRAGAVISAMKDDPVSEGISHPDQSADAIEGCRFENDRQLLEAIFEASPECIKIVAPDGRLVRMNPSGLGMVEVEPGEVMADVLVMVKVKVLVCALNSQTTVAVEAWPLSTPTT